MLMHGDFLQVQAMLSFSFRSNQNIITSMFVLQEEYTNDLFKNGRKLMVYHSVIQVCLSHKAATFFDEARWTEQEELQRGDDAVEK